jgi:hypothetical protein
MCPYFIKEIYMAGEIHGIIDREQAWAMWKPYGERTKGEYDHDVHPETFTALEAAHIETGMSRDAWKNVSKQEFGEYAGYALSVYRNNLEELPKPSDNLIAWFTERQGEQTHEANRLTDEWEKTADNFLRLIGEGALLLCKDGTLTGQQADKVHYWLRDESGRPRVEYTPTTHLAEARRLRDYNVVMPMPRLSPTTSFSEGIISHPVKLGQGTHMGANRVHEHVHSGFAGAEFSDVTLDNGQRYPAPGIFGLYSWPLSSAIDANYTYEGTKDGELNEGITDYLSHRLMDAVPALGEYSEKGQYQVWIDRVAKLRMNDSSLFRKIIDTYFVEATVANPTAKRDAVAEMHEYANKRMGKSDALTHLMTEATGTLHQVKSNN